MRPAPGRQVVSAAEEAVWLSDRPADPRVVALIARLDGHADLRRLQAAVAALLRAQQRLASRPAAGLFARRWEWGPVSVGGERVIVASGGALQVAAVVERLRTAVAGLRAGLGVGLVQQAEHDTVVLVVHHALSDGAGALKLLAELLGRGAWTVRAPTPEPALADPAVAADPAPRPSVPGRRLALPQAPSRLAPKLGETGQMGYGCQLTTRNPVRAGSSAGPATTNDLLVASTARAVEQWNASQDGATGRVVVNMPVNTQPVLDRTSGVGNATGQAVITVDELERARDAVLAAVVRQTRQVKTGREGHVAPAERVVGALQWLPARLRARLLRALARRVAPVLMPTITVSNVGRTDALFGGGSGAAAGAGAGQPPVQALWFLTTAGMPQGLTVTAASLRGTLHLAVSYSRELFDDDAGRYFLDLVASGIDELAEQADVSR